MHINFGPSIPCNLIMHFLTCYLIKLVKGLNPGVISKVGFSLIVRVTVVLNRTVVLLTVTDVSTTCTVVMFRVKVSCIMSVDGIILWLLI